MTEKMKKENKLDKEEQEIDFEAVKNDFEIKTEKEKIGQEHESALKEIKELKDQLMYLAADNENFRKRTKKQIEDAEKFAVNKFANDLVEVLENLYLATDNISTEMLKENEMINSIFQGVEMTKNTMLNVFSKYGIKRILPEVGEVFDHNLHEAVSYIPQEGYSDNSIINVMRAGYMLHDRLLKPAMVVVAKSTS